MYTFQLAEFTPAELAETSALLRSVFTHAPHLTPAYLDWNYRQNPDGKAVACNAFAEGRLVGHMAALPLRATVDGVETFGMINQNGAIAPGHRGRGLQSGISAAMFEEGLRRGYRFALGVGNRYSTGPLLTRFKMLKPLEARLGVGPLRRRDGVPAPSFERLWNAQSLAWRLADPQRAPSVRAGQVLAPTGIPGMSAILHDSVDLPDSGPASPGPLRLYLGLDPALDLGRSAFLPIPARLRPSPLNLVWRDLTGAGYLPDPERMIFRGLDLDAY